MFASFKRLIGPPPIASPEGDVLSAWAKTEGHVFKRVKENAGHGHVVETQQGWRVEWGDTQRPYIHGKELRFRSETNLSSDVQLILVTKALMHKLESEVFSSYTHAMETQVDQTLPDEMRWLAMHQRVSLAVSPTLAKRFALISNSESIAALWLDDHMLNSLEAAANTWWKDTLMLVLTVNRGLLTVRTGGQALDAELLKAVGDLFAKMAVRLREVTKR